MVQYHIDIHQCTLLTSRFSFKQQRNELVNYIRKNCAKQDLNPRPNMPHTKTASYLRLGDKNHATHGRTGAGAGGPSRKMTKKSTPPTSAFITVVASYGSPPPQALHIWCPHKGIFPILGGDKISCFLDRSWGGSRRSNNPNILRMSLVYDPKPSLHGWLQLLRVDCLPRFYPRYLQKELRSRLEFRSGTPTILGGRRTADGGGDAERTLIMPPWKSFGVDSRDGGLWYRPRMYCTEWFDWFPIRLCFHFRCMHSNFFLRAKIVSLFELHGMMIADCPIDSILLFALAPPPLLLRRRAGSFFGHASQLLLKVAIHAVLFHYDR